MRGTKQLLVAALAVIIGLGPTAAAMEPQQRSNWCWAACVQEVLRFHGINQSQAQIVFALRRAVVNTPANMPEVAYLLNGYGLQANSINRPATFEELVSTLRAGRVIIALINPAHNPTMGHFVVLKGVTPDLMIGVGDPRYGTITQMPAQGIYGATWFGSVVIEP